MRGYSPKLAQRADPHCWPFPPSWRSIHLQLPNVGSGGLAELMPGLVVGGERK